MEKLSELYQNHCNTQFKYFYSWLCLSLYFIDSLDKGIIILRFEWTFKCRGSGDKTGWMNTAVWSLGGFYTCSQSLISLDFSTKWVFEFVPHRRCKQSLCFCMFCLYVTPCIIKLYFYFCPFHRGWWVKGGTLSLSIHTQVDPEA